MKSFNEYITEMDKSQTPPGRDGSNDSDAGKKEYTAKVTTSGKVAKDALKILNKNLNKKKLNEVAAWQRKEGKGCRFISQRKPWFKIANSCHNKTIKTKTWIQVRKSPQIILCKNVWYEEKTNIC